MENCAECGKPISTNEASYYQRDPSGGDFGKSYHSACGDPFGIKAKDAEIERLRAAVEDAVETLEAMDMHIDNPLYARLRGALEQSASKED